MKKSLEDLALFGGTLAFSGTLHVGSPNVGNCENLLMRINDILDRRWLTNSGMYVRKFEQRMTELLGIKH